MRLKLASTLLALGIMVLIGLQTPARAEALTLVQQNKANNIISQLGSVTCENERLSDCKSQASQSLREYIGQQVAAGTSEEKILAEATSLYGASILLTPSKKGFNLVLWLSPFILIGVGLLLIALLISRWTMGKARRTPDKQVDNARRVKPGPQTDKLVDELAKFDY